MRTFRVSIDHRGRVVIPGEIRRALDIPQTSKIVFYTDDEGNIRIRAAREDDLEQLVQESSPSSE